MRESEAIPRCKVCGEQMYMTRFQSDVSPQGINREQLYECLWCGEGEMMRSEERRCRDQANVAA
jgi:hypothetical protein